MNPKINNLSILLRKKASLAIRWVMICSNKNLKKIPQLKISKSGIFSLLPLRYQYQRKCSVINNIIIVGINAFADDGLSFIANNLFNTQQL